MKVSLEGAAGARADGLTDPTTGISAGDAGNGNGHSSGNGNGNVVGFFMGGSESHPSGSALHAFPSLMAVTPAGGNRSPAGGIDGAGGGLDGSGGGGREWGGVVGESMVNRLLSALIDCPRQGGGKEGGIDGRECKDEEEEDEEDEEDEEEEEQGEEKEGDGERREEGERGSVKDEVGEEEGFLRGILENGNEGGGGAAAGGKREKNRGVGKGGEEVEWVLPAEGEVLSDAALSGNLLRGPSLLSHPWGQVDFGQIKNSQLNSWQPNSGQIWGQMEGGRGAGGGLLGGGAGDRGSGLGGPLSAEEWRGMGLEARMRLELAHVGLLRVHGLQESQRQDDEISASLRMSHRRLQAKEQHNQHKAAYLEEVVASRRLEEERSCEKLVVDRLLEMAYARRTGLKMAGAAGTITKGAGSSLKLARQSAVHFVRHALQRADQWHAGTLLPHLQRVHPDLQPSPSLLSEPSLLPWTPGPGGVGTPGLGGVGRSSGVVTTPGGTPNAPAGATGAATSAAGAAGGAGAGGLDGSGAGLSGAGASAPSLLALFNRQRLALFPPSPPRPSIPLSFAPTATTTAAAAAGGCNENIPGGESPALQIAGLSPLRAGGGEEDGAGGAAGGVPEAETDSLVASMLIAGSPCDSFREGALLILRGGVL
ncbi:unnamed protein product [Closterium sp. Yama58-4]|nr:unnamed protein product [Closterium sp. Yama58-4]